MTQRDLLAELPPMTSAVLDGRSCALLRATTEADRVERVEKWTGAHGGLVRCRARDRREPREVAA